MQKYVIERSLKLRSTSSLALLLFLLLLLLRHQAAGAQQLKVYFLVSPRYATEAQVRRDRG
jgi:hypothetical protein